jgi:MYXO-CTERM domain-containing protein
MQLKNRLDAHFASAAAVAVGAAMVGAAHQADAGIVWSGIVNINIPSNVDGVYLNVITGQSGSSGSSAAGWDLNPYSSSNLTFFAPSGGGMVRGFGSSASLVDNLAYLTVIGAGASFNYGTGSVETSGATGMNLNSSENLVGFQFVNEATGATHYGWARLQFTGATFTQPRAIVEYAFESTAGASIQAGVIPAPGALALLAAAGLMARRRRR